MRYRRYISTKQSDGSTVVVSHGPVIGFYRLLYRPFLLFFLIGFLWEFFSLHFATARGVPALLRGADAAARTIKSHA